MRAGWTCPKRDTFQANRARGVRCDPHHDPVARAGVPYPLGDRRRTGEGGDEARCGPLVAVDPQVPLPYGLAEALAAEDDRPQRRGVGVEHGVRPLGGATDEVEAATGDLGAEAVVAEPDLERPVPYA